MAINLHIDYQITFTDSFAFQIKYCTPKELISLNKVWSSHVAGKDVNGKFTQSWYLAPKNRKLKTEWKLVSLVQDIDNI